MATIRLVLTSGRVRPSGSEIPDSGRFVAKPYSLDTLVERIQEATDKPDLAAELWAILALLGA